MHAALAHWEELLAEYRAAAERRGEIHGSTAAN